MPSQLHEALLQLFRNRPPLAPELLRDALGVALPAYTEARVESADLGDFRPVELRADLVVLLCDHTPVLGIVVEAQLRRRLLPQPSAPAQPSLRRGMGRRLGQKAGAQPIDLGAGNLFTPLVLGPAGVPFIDDTAVARADPEAALRIAVAALTASAGLDPERSRLYFDLVAASLGDAARKAFGEMDPAKYEYQSEFAKHYIALGRAEGEARGIAEGRSEGRSEGKVEGKVELITRQLTRRFGLLPATVRERLAAASPAELDQCAGRVLDAASIADVFGDR